MERSSAKFDCAPGFIRTCHETKWTDACRELLCLGFIAAANGCSGFDHHTKARLDNLNADGGVKECCNSSLASFKHRGMVDGENEHKHAIGGGAVYLTAAGPPTVVLSERCKDP